MMQLDLLNTQPSGIRVGDILSYYGLEGRWVEVLEIFPDGDRAKLKRWDGKKIYGDLCQLKPMENAA